ncbi:Uncharacterised protein [Acinetobacter baumannii]|nr:Uncharacterised protein [Acinetobacter baumannii]
MLFDQAEALRGVRIGGEHHQPGAIKHAQHARRTHRVVVRHRQRAQIAGLRVETADLHAAANAVVVIVVGARDQLRRAGAAAGKLEERYPIGRGRLRDKTVAGFFQPGGQRQLALGLAAQRHDAQRRMRIAEGAQELIVGKQRVPAIGDQQRRFDLLGIGVQLAALMAEQRVDRHHANFQQREEHDIKFRHVAQLHQRGVAGFHAAAQQSGRQAIGALLQLAVGQAALGVDNRRSVVVGLAVEDLGQRLVNPVAALAIAAGELRRPGGKGNAHLVVILDSYQRHAEWC